MLKSDGALLKPLTKVRSFVEREFPEARMRIVPGDEVSASYLDVFIPADDYPSFWDSYTRIRAWIIEHVSNLNGIFQIVPRPAKPASV